MEIVRQKNVATYVVFPIVDADGDFVVGAAGLDSEIDSWADGSAPSGFVDCTNEATQISSTGIYYLSLTQAEMNADYIVVWTKSSTTGAKAQLILIRTTVGDPLNFATTDDGGTINVAAGVVDANAVQLSGDTTAANNAESFFDGTGYSGTNNTIPTVTNVTNAVSANVTQISGDTAAADNLESYCDGTTPIPANMTQISDDATAANNAESFFDGTGYSGTNNTIPTVTNVTNAVSANVTQISGDATAADNLESYCDGTTPIPANPTQVAGSSTAASRLSESAATMRAGVVDTAVFSPTATEFETSSLTEATADHWKDRVVIFRSGSLDGQAKTITAYSLVGGRGHFTCDDFTGAPSNSDTFEIV